MTHYAYYKCILLIMYTIIIYTIKYVSLSIGCPPPGDGSGDAPRFGSLCPREHHVPVLLFGKGKTEASSFKFLSPLLGVASSSHPGKLQADVADIFFFIKLTTMFLLLSSNVEDAPRSCIGPLPNAGGPYWCVVRK